MGAAVLRNTFAPNAILGGSFLPDDVTLPVLTGAITVGAKTSSTIAISWPAGSDNIGVTGYEVHNNGGVGPWIGVGNVLTYTFTGIPALTSRNLLVRAYDAAGNKSSPSPSVTTSTYRAGALGSTILRTTGPVDGNPAGILYNDVEIGDEGKWFSFVITTPPATGTLDINADGTFTFTGPSAETMYYQLEVDGSNVGVPQLVTLYDLAGTFSTGVTGSAQAADVVVVTASALSSATDTASAADTVASTVAAVISASVVESINAADTAASTVAAVISASVVESINAADSVGSTVFTPPPPGDNNQTNGKLLGMGISLGF